MDVIDDEGVLDIVKWIGGIGGNSTSIESISTLNPLKIVVTSIIFLQLLFLVMYRHHILDYLCFFKVHLINLKLNLVMKNLNVWNIFVTK
jgi:hypothetical protein